MDDLERNLRAARRRRTAILNRASQFVLVGGHVVEFHGHPRATKDMDVLIRAL